MAEPRLFRGVGIEQMDQNIRVHELWRNAHSARRLSTWHRPVRSCRTGTTPVTGRRRRPGAGRLRHRPSSTLEPPHSPACSPESPGCGRVSRCRHRQRLSDSYCPSVDIDSVQDGMRVLVRVRLLLGGPCSEFDSVSEVRIFSDETPKKTVLGIHPAGGYVDACRPAVRECEHESRGGRPSTGRKVPRGNHPMSIRHKAVDR